MHTAASMRPAQEKKHPAPMRRAQQAFIVQASCTGHEAGMTIPATHTASLAVWYSLCGSRSRHHCAHSVSNADKPRGCLEDPAPGELSCHDEPATTAHRMALSSLRHDLCCDACRTHRCNSSRSQDPSYVQLVRCKSMPT